MPEVACLASKECEHDSLLHLHLLAILASPFITAADLHGVYKVETIGGASDFTAMFCLRVLQ
jgi:hypothetical protein